MTNSFFDADVPDIALEIVHTAGECLSRLQARHFDALLLDHHLPDMHGGELLKELANRKLAVPVIMVTGTGDEELVVRLLRLGAMDYVSKRGTYVETLPDVVRTTISQHRRLEQKGLRIGPRRRRLLYVERNEADIDLTVRHFAESAPQWSIDVVRSSRDALRLMHERQFDLVMTDLRMPDLNALDLLREAKHRGLQLPFIILTGRGEEAAAVAALKLGAYEYIVKQHEYLTQLPYAADNAVDRFQLEQTNVRLEAELAHRERLQAALREQGGGPRRLGAPVGRRCRRGHFAATPGQDLRLVHAGRADARSRTRRLGARAVTGPAYHRVAWWQRGGLQRRARAIAKGFKPEAIVLDVGLPRMNGYDVARTIRRMPELSDVNIIAATGYGQIEDRERALEAGFNHYLVKPIELDALLQRRGTSEMDAR